MMYFFFSSRRRHTRYCVLEFRRVLSDLAAGGQQRQGGAGVGRGTEVHDAQGVDGHVRVDVDRDRHRVLLGRGDRAARSEERRVGKSVDLGGRRIIKKKKTASVVL